MEWNGMKELEWLRLRWGNTAFDSLFHNGPSGFHKPPPTSHIRYLTSSIRYSSSTATIHPRATARCIADVCCTVSTPALMLLHLSDTGVSHTEMHACMPDCINRIRASLLDCSLAQCSAVQCSTVHDCSDIHCTRHRAGVDCSGLERSALRTLCACSVHALHYARAALCSSGAAAMCSYSMHSRCCDTLVTQQRSPVLRCFAAVGRGDEAYHGRSSHAGCRCCCRCRCCVLVKEADKERRESRNDVERKGWSGAVTEMVQASVWKWV